MTHKDDFRMFNGILSLPIASHEVEVNSVSTSSEVTHRNEKLDSQSEETSFRLKEMGTLCETKNVFSESAHISPPPAVVLFCFNPNRFMFFHNCFAGRSALS